MSQTARLCARLDRLAAICVDFLARVHLPFAAGTGPTLIVRSTSLGDFIVLMPFLATILKDDPEFRLLLLSRTGDVGSMVLPQYQGRIAVINPSSLRSLLTGICSVYTRYRTLRFSRIVFATQNADSPFGKLRRLVTTRLVAGFCPPALGLSAHPLISSRRELELSPIVPALNQALVPFFAADVPISVTRHDCRTLLSVTNAERSRAEALIREQGGRANCRAIAMYVHAKDARKRWPRERYVEVVRWLLKNDPREVWIIGGADDEAASRDVAAMVPEARVIVLAGRASVREMLALLERCDLFIGNDGAPTHLAALQGSACITIYCNWDVGFWEPIAAPHSLSLRPTWKIGRTGDDFGIRVISSQAVIHAIRDLRSDTIDLPHRVRYIDETERYQERSCPHTLFRRD